MFVVDSTATSILSFFGLPLTPFPVYKSEVLYILTYNNDIEEFACFIFFDKD